MFDIGLPELAIILVVALLVFGPGKMVEIGRELGKAVRDFRRATGDLQKEFNDALKLDEPVKPLPPRVPPPAPPILEPEVAAASPLLTAAPVVVAADQPPAPAPEAASAEPVSLDAAVTPKESATIQP